MIVKRILVPIDFSPHSRGALDYAIDFARAHRAELLMLHVVEPIRNTRLMPDVSLILEDHRAQAAEQLAKLEKRTRQRFRKCRSEIHFGIPFEVIAEVAEKSKADLIVIATHGYSGLHHLILGSVAERVVRLAKCPVLTVRAAAEPAKRVRARRGAAKAVKG